MIEFIFKECFYCIYVIYLRQSLVYELQSCLKLSKSIIKISSCSINITIRGVGKINSLKNTEINGQNIILPNFNLKGMLRMLYKQIVLGPLPLFVFYEQLQNMREILRMIGKLCF